MVVAQEADKWLGFKARRRLWRWKVRVLLWRIATHGNQRPRREFYYLHEREDYAKTLERRPMEMRIERGDLRL